MEANDTMAVNAKTFRKIAKMIRRLVDHIRKEKSLPEKLARETFDQIDDLAKEALITPPRNCDVGAAEEQHRRFADYCNECDCPMGCIHRKEFVGMLDTRCASMLKCYIRWAQMPYEAETKGET